jgi:hypothetical protein
MPARAPTWAPGAWRAQRASQRVGTGEDDHFAEVLHLAGFQVSRFVFQ